MLKKFINSGPKPNNTIFTYESRGANYRTDYGRL